ncbi:hypothetical protein Tco_0442002 [Tanacetum coccineum]
MDTLSDVSEYLNNLETLMDDGDSLEIRMGKIEKSEEELEMFEALEHKSVVVEVNKHKVQVIKGVGTEKMRKNGNIQQNSHYGRNYGVIDIMDYALINYYSKNIYANKGLRRNGVDIITPRRYKELEEQKPIIEVLENYMVYRKKLNEVMKGKERLENKNFCEKEKDMLIEKGLPKKILYKNLGVSDPRPYHANLTMAENTQGKSVGEVRNVRIQIGYQAYLADFLVLDIPIDKELPILLGRPFLRTCGAIIDMERGTMTIDNGVIRHTYFPKPRAKGYLENFEVDEDEN